MATGGKNETTSNLLKVGTVTLKSDDLCPRGVVVVGDKLVITDTESHKVRVYRRHDGMLLSSTDELESKPLGLCRVSDTELCVAMSHGIIAIMSVQDPGLISRGKTFDLRPTFDGCDGVALWNDNIVVSGRKDNTICWCVVCLEDGRPDKLHKVCEGEYFSFLTVKQDMVYISCRADSVYDRGVYRFNLLNPSQPTYTYKHKELIYPCGITVDDIGHLFVCDYSFFNSSIHHLTGNCELVTIYKNDLPRNPVDIFWDSGVLYVTSMYSNVITMYKTPQQGIHGSILRRLSKDLIDKNWRFFFRELSVTDREIQQIEIDYHNSGVWEQIYQLLCRSNDKGILNKASIIEALQSIDRFDLVTKYKQETFPDS